MSFSNYYFLHEKYPRLQKLADSTDLWMESDPYAAMIHMKAVNNELIGILSKDHESSVIHIDHDDFIYSLWKFGLLREDIYLIIREIELFNIHESEMAIDGSRIEYLFHRLHDVLVWFFRTYEDNSFIPNSFVEPRLKVDATKSTFPNGSPHDDVLFTPIHIDGNVRQAEWELSMHTLSNYESSQYENGDNYEGQVERGLKHGQGIYTWQDGTIYKGQWKKDQEHGYGEKKFANGDRYVGLWENGLFSGSGNYHWSDGSYYEGQWLDGFEHGYGTKVDADEIMIKGFWTYGEFVYTSNQLE